MADPAMHIGQMAAFSREKERINMASEIMDDALIEDSESEADEIVDQVHTLIITLRGSRQPHDEDIMEGISCCTKT